MLMTNARMRRVLFLLLATLSFTSIHAQSAYELPEDVNFDAIVRRNFRSFYVRAYPGGPIQRLYAEAFYPIGWSRDGKFAYYTEPVDEECGCYYAELIIQDLRTDKVLWKFENKPQERMDEKGSIIPDDMDKLWARNRTLFTEKLREHGIEQVARFRLLPLTFRSAGRSYTARLTVLKGDDSDGLNRARKMSLNLSSPSLGRKSLFTETHTGDLYGAPLDAGLAGVFKSPFEDRAAVLMLKVQRGWEGPPHTVTVHIAGADLNTGFKKF